ncbi:YciI family protein [Schaalia cardiffensis]|uniref:YciI family protein n=1 Tax=Schaalia cardiffensis TaxID=181487 RepID=UPI0023F44EBE|nr:YciI family protein [Schaalia cardiffensis]
MAFFAVTYAYDPELSELADEIRPTHRAFLSDLRDKGLNVASGPLGGDTPGALLIIEAENLDEVEVLLDEDPFKKAKVVSERVVRPWNPVISRF